MTIKFFYNGNETTRTFPRTLAEAFPATPQPNFEDDMDNEDKLICLICVIMFVFMFTLMFLGVV